KVLKKPGAMIDVTKDKLTVSGREVEFRGIKGHTYLMLNKPVGYISTAADTHNRRTILELVPKIDGIFTVGRLDKDTTGVILITSDGELAHRLMHPSYEIDKVYEVFISRCLSDKDITALKHGVDIKEERPSVCDILECKRSISSTIILLKIHEGRKRQIRRTFESLGYSVTSLKRVSYGGIKLDLKEGEYRHLKAEEVKYLKEQVKL
ncbi:MAG: pseudouridine synthase, partial [Candidatus Omnitrophota bacterium]